MATKKVQYLIRFDFPEEPPMYMSMYISPARYGWSETKEQAQKFDRKKVRPILLEIQGLYKEDREYINVERI